MANYLKAISETETEIRVGNYIVLFGGSDLTGESFSPRTNLRSNYTDIGTLYVDFEHGADPDGMGNSEGNVIGVVDWKTAKADNNGVFVERVLNRRADYVRFLRELIDQGLIGTSSEAIPGQSRRTSEGEITDWPLMRDSLTVTPMEPRMLTDNVLRAAKALQAVFPASKSLRILLPEALPGRWQTVREFEEFVRPRLGLTKNQARHLATKGWRGIEANAADDTAHIRALADNLKSITSLIKKETHS